MVINMPECTTHCLWFPEQDKELTLDDQHDHGHQHARMHNSLPMISRAGQRIDMEWSAWLQSPTCQNAQLTAYDFQSRTKNGHGIISMITVTKIPACTTHWLWFPEQVREWTWDDQHDHSQWHAIMHNSQAMIARVEKRMDMAVTTMPECTTHLLRLPKQDKECTWDNQYHPSHLHTRMYNSPPMIAKAGKRMDMEWSAWSQSPTCQNAHMISRAGQ